eukprot:Pgem_evm1s19652
MNPKFILLLFTAHVANNFVDGVSLPVSIDSLNVDNNSSKINDKTDKIISLPQSLPPTKNSKRNEKSEDKVTSPNPQQISLPMKAFLKLKMMLLTPKNQKSPLPLHEILGPLKPL